MPSLDGGEGPDDSRPTGPRHDRYELSCAGCEFERVVTGTIETVYDAIDEHREHASDRPDVHFVEFERRP